MNSSRRQTLNCAGPGAIIIFLLAVVPLLRGQEMAVDAVSTPAELAAEQRIRALLDEPADFELLESPLSDFVELLSSRGIPVRLDLPALHAAGVDPDEPLTWHAPGECSRRAGLALLLESLDLTWCIRLETLLITTQEQASRYLKVRLYDISHIIVAQDDSEGLRPRRDRFAPEALAETIVAAIDTDSWDDYGGEGTLKVLRGPQQAILVVSQTDRVHEKISRFITVLGQMLQRASG